MSIFALLLFGDQSFFSSTAEYSTQKNIESSLNFQNSIFPRADAAFGVNDLSIFANYTAWTNSATLKSTDTFTQLLYLGGGNSTPLTFLDINGDGLVDALYLTNVSGSLSRYAVFLNNGSQGFNLIYKCYYDASALRYYGDCAG